MERTSTMKKCTKCGEEKPATTKFFPKKKNGLYSWCKVCKNTAGREWNKKNAAYYKKWRKDNLERKNQTDKEWKKITLIKQRQHIQNRMLKRRA